MSQIRFNQVFVALMLLSGISAFIIPSRYTDMGRVQFEGIFIPVSRPIYHLANWTRGRLVTEAPDDPRPNATIAQENVGLRQEVTRLQMQLERLSALAAEQKSLGNLNDFCRRLTVTGVDPGAREGLTLGGSVLGDIRENQPVLYTAGLVGRIDRAGVSAAHVKLITDVGFAVSGRFVRFVNSGDRVEAVKVSKLLAVVQGAGGGEMVIINLSAQDVSDAKIQPGDWVVLDDGNWPAAVQSVRLGRVASIGRWEKMPLLAELRLAPESGLMRLNDVWVMTKQ